MSVVDPSTWRIRTYVVVVELKMHVRRGLFQVNVVLFTHTLHVLPAIVEARNTESQSTGLLVQARVYSMGADGE
jgi:type I site-specific restriction endonuclease